VTLGTLVIWSLSRSDHGTRMPCLDGFVWSAGSDMNCQWYETLRRLIKIPDDTDYYYCINHMTCSTHVYYCPFIFVTIPDMLSTIMSPVYLITLSYICYFMW